MIMVSENRQNLFELKITFKTRHSISSQTNFAVSEVDLIFVI